MLRVQRSAQRTAQMSQRSLASFFGPPQKRPRGASSPIKASPSGLEPDSTNKPSRSPETVAAESTPAPSRAVTASTACPDDTTPTSTSQLSAEQKRRVEENRRAAIAEKRAKELQARVRAAAENGTQVPWSDLLVEPSWRDVMAPELEKQYFRTLESFLASEKGTIYPPREATFRAFNECPFESVRVVLLGQDPYHGPGQAMGLCFSVPRGVKVPSSLQNMYKELESDLGAPRPPHGDLRKWAKQGVFMLNTTLTVRAASAGSHAKKGWETFTDAAIRALSARRTGLVFLLWGKHAQAKKALIDTAKHTVLEAPHPSGLSAHRGFFGCRHFSKANGALEKAGLGAIDWRIEP